MQLKFTQESDFRRERDFGAKISATFEFIGAHWRPLGKCLLYFVIPTALLMGIALGVAQNQSFRLIGQVASTPAEQLTRLGNIYSNWTHWLGLIMALISYTLLGATVYGYVRVRMALPHEQEVTPALVWQQLLHLAPRLGVSTVVVTVITMIGFILLVIPGIYLSVALSLVWAIQAFEDSALGAGTSRSLSLIRGKWWSTLGLIFIMSVVIGIVGSVLQIPRYVSFVGKLLHWEWLGSDGLLVAGSIMSSVGQMILYVPLILVLMFQYFNLVERKEDVGLRSLVDSLGSSPAPVAHNHAYRPDDEGEY